MVARLIIIGKSSTAYSTLSPVPDYVGDIPSPNPSPLLRTSLGEGIIGVRVKNITDENEVV